MQREHSDNHTVNPESLNRVSGMLATLPQDAQGFLLDLFARSYETVSRLGPERLVEIRRHSHQHPGETSAEKALNQFYQLLMQSPVSSEQEQVHVRRLRSRQRLQRLLLGDGDEPPLSSDEVATWLGKSPQVVNRQAKSGRYVAALVRGSNRYPVWQFTPHGSVPSEELAALFSLFGGARRWPWIAFLRTPQPDLDEYSPIDWLNGGGEFAPVKRLAKKRAGLIQAL